MNQYYTYSLVFRRIYSSFSDEQRKTIKVKNFAYYSFCCQSNVLTRLTKNELSLRKCERVRSIPVKNWIILSASN